jgi:hypothetical protein
VDDATFDRFTRGLATAINRQNLIRGFAGVLAGIGISGLVPEEDAEAGRKKRRRKRRRRRTTVINLPPVSGGGGGAGGSTSTTVIVHTTIPNYNVPGAGNPCSSGCQAKCPCHQPSGVCCPAKTACPTDGRCGKLLVPAGCPEVVCGCPSGHDCKDGTCQPTDCPKPTCPDDFCGEKSNECGTTKCECSTGKTCKDHVCVPDTCPKPVCPPTTEFCGEKTNECGTTQCNCPTGKECKDNKCVPTICHHSFNNGCKPTCTSVGEGCGQSCEKDICDAACPEKAGTEDRECSSGDYCRPECFTCVDKVATFIC